jgi:predicted O-linked N-acetylglucosamine transferase (SPINDLY family)
MASSQHPKQKKNNQARPTTLNFGAHQLVSQQAVQADVLDVRTAAAYLQQATQCLTQNQVQEAVRLTQLCIKGVRGNAEVLLHAKWICAVALLQQGNAEQALIYLLEIEKSMPTDVSNLSNIGAAMLKLGRYRDAQVYFQRVIQRQADEVDAYHGLGHAFYAQGQCHEALQAYSRAFELAPQLLGALEGKMFMQYYLYPVEMTLHLANARRYGEFFKDTAPLAARAIHPKSALRVGLVSGDLNNHPVSYFLASTLAHIHTDAALSQGIELIAYHNNSQEDHYSAQLKEYFSQWHQVHAWSDSQLAGQVQQDRIDILMDLSGHTHRNRLAIFALKPAPIQISWLGYWGSTGLSTMDYILADPDAVPAGEAQWFVEQVWRLPHLRYCFSIPVGAPDVSVPPCTQQATFVFGSYQVLAKINQHVLTCWSRVLAACPQARLRIQAKELSQPAAKTLFIQRLNELQMDITRVELLGSMSYPAYLASYAEVDVLLDTFPYPGGTTTAEALWMGVPTLTLATPGMLGRQGAALMANAGLADWVVDRADDYVAKAVLWANADDHQRQSLAMLRLGMRDLIRDSPVFNAEAFAHEFVSALHEIWQQKCASVERRVSI